MCRFLSPQNRLCREPKRAVYPYGKPRSFSIYIIKGRKLFKIAEKTVQNCRLQGSVRREKQHFFRIRYSAFCALRIPRFRVLCIPRAKHRIFCVSQSAFFRRKRGFFAENTEKTKNFKKIFFPISCAFFARAYINNV